MSTPPNIRDPEVLLAEAEKIASMIPTDIFAKVKNQRQHFSGAHRQRAQGEGESFWQYREYNMGDPATMVDWRRTAKTDKAYVREKELQNHGTVWFWRDASLSMDFTSEKKLPTKFDAANLIIATLAIMLVGNGEMVGLLGSENFVASGRNKLLEICQRLTESKPDSDEFEIRKSNSKYVFISDFLFPKDKATTWLDWVNASNSKAMLFKVNDPLESDFKIKGRTLFINPETGEKLEIGEPDELQSRYRSEFFAHEKSVAELAHQKSGDFYKFNTGENLALFMVSIVPTIAEQLVV